MRSISCAGCWGAAVDAAACRARCQTAIPVLDGAEVLPLPSGACIRVRVTPRSSSAPATIGTVVLSCDPPNSVETHVHLDAELASRGFAVVSFELPGFGFSTPPPGFNFTLAANEAVVAELLDELSPRLPRPVTLALSCVAGLAARRLASRTDAQSRWGIGALVSIQTPSHAAEIAWARRADRQGFLHTPVLGQTVMLALHGAVIDSWYRVALGRGRADPLRAPLEAAAHAARKAGAHNCLASAFQMLTHTHEAVPAAALPSRPLPALSVWGAADRSHRGTDRTSSLADWPGGSESVEFPDAGHFPELEAPREFAEALSKFVRGATSPLPPAGEPRL